MLTRERIVERAKGFRDPTLLEADYHAALDDLTVRNIITVNNDHIDMKMPVFKDWLDAYRRRYDTARFYATHLCQSKTRRARSPQCNRR